jgi:hypothetical protein
MAIKSEKNNSGTSFHNHVICCSAKELTLLLGDPTYEQNTGEDKTNLEWVCETENGQVFTIYDWKIYRPLNQNEEVEWHIGGHSHEITLEAQIELIEQLSK